MNKEIDRLLINKNSSIKEAMKVIDRGTFGIAFVVDDQNKFLGVVTDGDIRRTILKGMNIGKKVIEITNEDPIVVKGGKGELTAEIEKRIREKITSGGSLKIPLVNEKGMVEDIFFVYINGNNILHQSKSKEKKEGFPAKELKRSTIKKVLLTGGAGYLGSVLCRKLLDRGYRVRVLDNLTYGDEGIKDLYGNRSFEFLKGDARNISDLTEAMKGMDAVMHLAAIVGDPASQLKPQATIEINYLSTKAAAETAKYNQINKFLFFSTCSVYGAGKTADERLKEDSSLNPVSLYAETKLKSEEGILNLADENFSPTIFRFATLYGVSPRVRFDLVVNTLTARAVLEKKISIFGGEQWRPNLEVSDAARACILWLEAPLEKVSGEIFNVGANEQNCKIIEIGRMVKKIVPETAVEIKKELDDLRDYNVSFDKILRVLGFRAKKTIEQSIGEMKKMIEIKKITNFNLPQYSNYRFLSEEGKANVFK